MTRTSLHAPALLIILFAAALAHAALPQDRPFHVTIRNASQCLAFGGNGNDTFPSRVTWGSGPYCGFATQDELLANRQAVWRLMPLGNDLYTITNASGAEGERCLIFGSNGKDTHPSRFNWNAGEYCGFPGRKPELLRNKQAVFKISGLGNDRYTIANASGSGEQCVIFGGRGSDKNPSRYNWGSGPYCGFPGGKDAFLANGQGVFLIEQVGTTDILDTLFADVYKADRQDHLGITYSLTTDNAFPAVWLLQTPNVWGKPADQVPPGAGMYVADQVKDLIAGAQQHVDIMTLMPFPDGRFGIAVREGLESLARAGRPVTVRILAGWPTGFTGVDQALYLQSLIVNLKDGNRFPNNKLQISVAAQREWGEVWNHAKIIAVDGKEMIIGGQNLWDGDHLTQNPVHDLSVRIQGSSTILGHRFADKIWAGPCGYTAPGWKPALWRAGMSGITTGCLPNPALKTPPPAGRVRVLAVGRLGIDRVFTAEASENAMWYAFEKTSGPIYIAQQDFMGTLVWDWTKPVVGAVVKQNRPVFLVVGDDYAKAGPPPGSTYKMPLRTMSALLSDVWSQAKTQRGTMTIPQLQDRLCSTLSVAPFRFGPSKRWPNGDMAIANHSKFWMIGSLYYVGSHNLYPAGLGELGVIVNDADSAATVKSAYWEKMWAYSKADARSGPDAGQCAFRTMN